MHPFSHSCDVVPKDEENLMEAALGAAKAMGKAHGSVVRTGSLCDKLYRLVEVQTVLVSGQLSDHPFTYSAPGNIVDWMYGYADVKVAYSIMLRDTGTVGFFLCPRFPAD